MSAPASPYSIEKLRRSGMHFLAGKLVSGALSFTWLLLLVRILPREEYGKYVSLIAACEVGYALSSLELAWLGARFIPEFYLKGGRWQLTKLSLTILASNAVALLVLSVMGYLGLAQFLGMMRLDVLPVTALGFLGILVLEGLGRMVREGILGPLLQQRAIQLSVALRQAVLVCGVGGLGFGANVHLTQVAWLECLASGLGFLIALGALAAHLWRLPSASDPNWQAPRWRTMWSAALAMYFSHLLSLASSPQVFLLLLQRALGAEASAAFGFLVNLYGQIKNYLPATLLFSLIRPKLVASYLEGGIDKLISQAHFTGRLSLLVLMPVIAWVAVSGDEIVACLSGGRFMQAGGWFLGLLVALIPYSQRQLLETVAVTPGQSRWCLFASLASSVGVVAMLLALKLDLGVWSAVIGVLVSQWVFNLTLQSALAWKIAYRPDWRATAKLLMTAILAAAVVWPWPLSSLGIAGLGLQAGLVGSAFLAMAWQFEVLGKTQWQRLRQVLSRRQGAFYS